MRSPVPCEAPYALEEGVVRFIDATRESGGTSSAAEDPGNARSKGDGGFARGW